MPIKELSSLGPTDVNSIDLSFALSERRRLKRAGKALGRHSEAHHAQVVFGNLSGIAPIKLGYPSLGTHLHAHQYYGAEGYYPYADAETKQWDHHPGRPQDSECGWTHWQCNHNPGGPYDRIKHWRRRSWKIAAGGEKVCEWHF
jgi:hypothetical protein